MRGFPLTVRYSHSAVTVSDLRTSLAFYQDALGLEPFNDHADDVLRSVDLRLPGTDRFWRLEEYRESARYPASSRPCDPGFAHVCLYVGDAEGVLRRLQKRGFTSRAPVQTVSSGAHTGAKAVYTMDPDGFVVELYQRAGETGPSEATGFFHHGITVADMDSTLAFWGEEVGVEILRRTVAPGAMAGPITAMQFEEVAAAFVALDESAQLEIFEYRGIERHSALARAVDPGSSRLALQVSDRTRLLGELAVNSEGSQGEVADPTGYPILILADS